MGYLIQRKSLIAASAVTVVVAVGGVSVHAAANDGGGSGVSTAQQLTTGTPGPHRFIQANGLNASDAKPVFTLRNGQTVSIVANGLVKCLVRSYGARSAGEPCVAMAAIAEGHGITVGDECGTSGKNLMEIAGLAPDGVASVHLRSSDGSSLSTSVVNGAFKFDGTNPADGAPYPTTVEWVGNDGRIIGTAGLPVNGSRFCMPTS